MLKETAELITDGTYNFIVTEKKKILFRKQEIKHEFAIPALNLFTMIRISKEVLAIDKELFHGKLISASMQLLAMHGEGLIKIIAYAVLNGEGNPDKKLLRQLSFMNADELLSVVTNILKHMNLKSFTTSIISIAGINVIEMNPKEQGS